MVHRYALISVHSDVAVADFFTDGHNIDWTVDNFGLQDDIKTFPELQAYVAESTSLRLSVPTTPTPNLRTFALSSGDVVSITDDGSLTLVNGKIIPEDQAVRLQEMIELGQLKLDGEGPKFPITSPIPQDKPLNISQSMAPEDKFGIKKLLAEKKEQDRKDDEMASVDYDKAIEREYKYNPIAKQLAYAAKYGRAKGGEVI